MPRTLVCLAAVAALVHPCLAGQTTTTSEMLIRLNVRPAPAPKPALRYRLLPELEEMNPGNPIQHYMKCMHGAEEILFRRRRLFSTARSCWPCRSRSCPRRSWRNTAGTR